jgi:hypothetical protein
MPNSENEKEVLDQINPKKNKLDDKNTSGTDDNDTEGSDDDSGDGDFGDSDNSDKNTDDAIIDDDNDDKPRFIKIIKDDAEFDEGMDDELRARLLSNTKDDLVKTDRKISEIINEDGQQEKDLRIFEKEKEVKKIISSKKDLKQEQRTKIDILRRVSDLFFGNKHNTPSNSVINNQKRLLATGLTPNDVTVKDKQLKHKVEHEKHHHKDHHDHDHHGEHDTKISFADKIRLQQEQHNHGHNDGGRNI